MPGFHKRVHGHGVLAGRQLDNAHHKARTSQILSRTVSSWLGDHRRGRLSLEETAFYVAELIEAVSEVHRYGHVHRDLKPEPWL